MMKRRAPRKVVLLALAGLVCLAAAPHAPRAEDRTDLVLPVSFAAPVSEALEAADGRLDHFVEQSIRIAENPLPLGRGGTPRGPHRGAVP